MRSHSLLIDNPYKIKSELCNQFLSRLMHALRSRLRRVLGLHWHNSYIFSSLSAQNGSTSTRMCVSSGHSLDCPFLFIPFTAFMHGFFFFLWRHSPNLGLGLPPWNSPFHFGLLDLRHSVRLLGWVISSSRGLYLHTNTEKRTHTNTKHPCPEWDSNPRSRLPGERR
jgi:hypothetical protein